MIKFKKDNKVVVIGFTVYDKNNINAGPIGIGIYPVNTIVSVNRKPLHLIRNSAEYDRAMQSFMYAVETKNKEAIEASAIKINELKPVFNVKELEAVLSGKLNDTDGIDWSNTITLEEADRMQGNN